ncbi:hypothetical protein Ancab_024514 [Ancistrocladus abbreviatus]
MASATPITDELFEIFSWLPATTLHKFKTVSKACSDLLTDNLFMQKQCHNSFSRPDDGFFIEENIIAPDRATNAELHSLPGCKFSTSMPRYSVRFLKKVRILASSNGLLLCRSTVRIQTDRLYVFNPATMDSFLIKLPTKTISKKHKHRPLDIVFSRDQNSGKFPHDYTLLLFVCHRSPGFKGYYCNTYSFEQGEWRKKADICTGERCIPFASSVLCNGKVYFLSDARPFLVCSMPYVACCDIHTGTSTVLKLPEDCSKTFYRALHIFGWEHGSVSRKTICLVEFCLLREQEFKVWVLQDVESTNQPVSWTFLATVSLQSIFPELVTEYRPISDYVVSKGYLIFAFKGTVYRYRLTGSEDGAILEKIQSSLLGANFTMFIKFILQWTLSSTV